MRATLLKLTRGWLIIAAAAPCAYAHGAKSQLNFLTEAALPGASAIKPAPAPGSDVDKADIKKLDQAQQSRTRADCTRAISEEPLSFRAFFGPPYGPLTDAEAQRLAPFFKEVENDAHIAVWNVKDHFQRPRPYLVHKELRPCVKKEDSSAYPSGHAEISRVFALVLGQLDPARADAFLARADQIAADRILGGVHHPSDIEAGKALGDKVFAALMASGKFTAALAAAKPEAKVPPGGGSPAP